MMTLKFLLLLPIIMNQ